MNISDRDVDIEPIEQKGQVQQVQDERQAFFNFIKSIIGIGAITYPYAANKVGWLGSILITIPVLFCTIKKLLFGDVVQLTLKWVWPQITNIMIILSQIGVCCAYLIFLYQSTDVVLNQVNIPMSKLTIFSLTLILIIPLSLIKRMKYFHHVSKLGFYVNLLAFVIVFFDCLTLIYRDGISYGSSINLSNTFQFIGIACLTLQCNLTILPIRNDMINKQPFQRYQELSLFLCFFISIFTTTFAIWGYKDNINQIIIFNIQNLYLRSITMIAYGICILMTYALQLFPAVQIIEEHFFQLTYKQFDQSEDENDNESVFVLDKMSLIIRGVLMLIIYIISYKIPDLSQFINLIGSFFGSFCQFLIPLLAHWICFKNQESSLKLKLEYFVMSIFTALAIIFGSYESIKGLM